MPESKDMCRVALQDVVGAACTGHHEPCLSRSRHSRRTRRILRLPHIALTALCYGGSICCAALITVRSGKATSG